MGEKSRGKEPLAAVLQEELQQNQARMDALEKPLSDQAAETQRDLGAKQDALQDGIRAVVERR